MINFPEGTTHFFRSKKTNAPNEFYKFVGTYTTNGNPEYVRWIKSRNSWAVTPQAFDHVKLYAEEV